MPSPCLAIHRHTLIELLACTFFIATLCSTVGNAASAQADDQPASPSSSPSVSYTSTVVADGLSHPWSIAFLPDGALIITERPGRLRILRDGNLSEPVAGVPPVYAHSQGGLFDVVLHPGFTKNGWIYLSFAHGDADANATRLVRGRLDENQFVDVETLFTAKPMKDTPVHYAGRFAFLPDLSLVLGVGDGFDYREQAQSLSSHLGKFIRVNDDGSIPADNPYIDTPEALPEIYSIGHRNQQAIVFDKIADKLWSHEHGPAGGDEINDIVPASNYGWPLATQGRDYSGAAISPFRDLEGTVAPAQNWTPSIAPAGMALITGKRFAPWQGNLLVAALKSRDVRRLSIEDGQLQEVEILFEEFGARLRDIREAPDGSLYLLTDDASDAKVIRIEPVL